MMHSTHHPKQDAPIRIGISACLLGEKVRYDGSHKEDRYLTHTLGRYFEWVPVCPEVELGLGIPRETIRLVRQESEVGLVTLVTGRDLTREMHQYAETRVRQLEHEDLCGYILKSNSPSCGMLRVRVYGTKGMPTREGRGLFAQSLIERLPNLPVEEEGRLSDPRLRENWIERVFAYRRLKSLWGGRWTIGHLVRFQTAHKLILLSHSPEGYRRLGRLVAEAKGIPRNELRSHYENEFMKVLAVPATRGRHANVLHHMMGYLRTLLQGDSRAELVETIADYQKGFVPLVVPLTLIKHHARRFSVEYLQEQIYLSPHPKELSLRNYV
jgi:uncharacterized protein YbgA (DUF1722 family)/uncharacterized protein YbbK (DUF523 family)